MLVERELAAAFFDGVLFDRTEVLKLQTAAETLTIAHRSCHAQPALNVRKNELHLHYLPALQFRWDVYGHTVFAQVMATSLQDTLALLHHGKNFDGKVHLEALRAANRMGDMCRN